MICLNRDFDDITKVIQQNISTAMIYAERIQEGIVSENPRIIFYLNKAMYNMGIAQSVYYANVPELSIHGIKELFFQFNVFTEEVLNNYVEDHSHQWSLLEFDKLKEIYESL